MTYMLHAMPLFRVLRAALIPALILADQFSKWLVQLFFVSVTDSYDLAVPGFFAWLAAFDLERLPFFMHRVCPSFNLVMVWNEGISFGLFGRADAGHLLALLNGGITLVFVAWMTVTKCARTALALTLVVAGALGNLWDRLRFGAVIDFIDLHAFGWHWPAFNLADSLIVCGIAFLVIDGLLFAGRQNMDEQTDNRA